jgi:23S rRNA (guanosine2251-2'-O)-methyltransferase
VRRAHTLYCRPSSKGLDEILAQARKRNVPVRDADRNQLEALAHGVMHQGVVLKAGALPVRKLENWLSGDIDSEAVVVILDGVEDPHNFGAIVRSASACGAAAVLFGKDRAAPLSAAACKSAAGAMEYVNLIQVTNVARTIQQLQKEGFWVAALDAQAPQTLWQANLDGRIALVVGSEGAGIRPLVQKRCDLQLRIPLAGPITSLNASVSASMVLAECLRRRQSKD